MLCSLLAWTLAVNGAVFFVEEFDAGWEDRWIQSKFRNDYGKVVTSAGQFFGDQARDAGLKTSEDSKHYAIAAKFPSFSNKEKTLVIQFSTKFEQKIDCGGGYLKFGPSTVDLDNFNSESQYNIMFGPDICGASARTHMIVNYKGKNHIRTIDIRAENDEFTHLYTLVLRPDQTYDVLIDQRNAVSGNLLADFDFLPPKTIPDPNAVKPLDWDDNEIIDDPNDIKPEGWDVPEYIADPDATKPREWDDDIDGKWEPPLISNPEYKGQWNPRKIPNPHYKGVWVAPDVSNPNYFTDDNVYAFEDFGYVGLDVWQVKSGTIFDNIIVTDNETEAKDLAARTFGVLRDVEKTKSDTDREERKKHAEEERAKRDAEIKAQEDEPDAEVEIVQTDVRRLKLQELKRRVHQEL